MFYLVIIYHKGTWGSAWIQQKYKEILNISNTLYHGLLSERKNFPSIVWANLRNDLFSYQRHLRKLIRDFYLWSIILGIRAQQTVGDQKRAWEKVDDQIRAQQTVDDQIRAWERVDDQIRAWEKINDQIRVCQKIIDYQIRNKAKVGDQIRTKSIVNHLIRIKEKVD